MPRILRSSPNADHDLINRALSELGTTTQCLKRDGDTAVFAVRADSRDLIVKQWSLTSPKRRLQALLHTTPAFRHWRGARWLEEAGIPTAACLAIARDQRTELLVMERLPGKTVLQHLADNDLSPRQQHRLAEAVGAQIVRLRQRGKGNRDHKPSNLIVTDLTDTDPPTDAATPTIAIIDCIGLRRRVSPIQMGKSLLAECLGTGLLPRRTLLMRCVWSISRDLTPRSTSDPLWHRWMRRTYWSGVRRAIARHGDPTPKVNPIPPRATNPG